MSENDISVIAWWIIILVLGFATVGLYTVFQILRTVWAKEPPPDGLGNGWPAGRFCVLLRIPKLGTVADGITTAGGRVRVKIELVEELADGSTRNMTTTGSISGGSGQPYHRMYSWNENGDVSIEAVT